MGVILKAENISKQYRLGVVGSGTLKDDLNRWWHQLRGKDDPFLKVGGVNDRSVMASEDYVWALRDINFEVERGEVLGIIGKNGAGKSTLLKLLSRITSPTTGTIKTKGRIASLLEVGTGFHGELTGRENIFMNGAVLGMTKTEIKRKLDEIIAFSGCEKYIDTPVKRYSSGMKVRLGFAVAAHLEPEILVVDEVLAVGDAEFQKKAIGKMQDLSTGEGRTVLFVSHNMASIRSLCTKALVLKDGQFVYEGTAEEAVDFYLQPEEDIVHQNLLEREDRTGNGKIRFSNIEILNWKSENIDAAISGDPLKIKIHFKIENNVKERLILGFSIKDFDQNIKALAVSDEFDVDINRIIDKGFIIINFDEFMMRGGKYSITLTLSGHSTLAENHIDRLENAFELNVLQGDYNKIGKLNRAYNSSLLKCSFE